MCVQRDPLPPIAFLLLCCMFLFVAGCSRAVGFQTTGTVGGTDNTYRDKYLLGINAYFLEDYNISAEAFLSVVENTGDPVLARKALYALACTHFMLADTRDEYQTAMSYWQAWLGSAPQNWALENPLLFDPIVAKQFVEPCEGRDDVQHYIEERTAPTATWSDMEVQSELAGIKAQLDAAKQQVAQQKNAIRVLEQENAKLKEQIRAIELIDQKIQEKKTAIPSAE